MGLTAKSFILVIAAPAAAGPLSTREYRSREVTGEFQREQSLPVNRAHDGRLPREQRHCPRRLRDIGVVLVPAPPLQADNGGIGRRLCTARIMRRDQNVRQFMEWSGRRSPLRLGLGWVLSPGIERAPPGGPLSAQHYHPFASWSSRTTRSRPSISLLTRYWSAPPASGSRRTILKNSPWVYCCC